MRSSMATYVGQPHVTPEKCSLMPELTQQDKIAMLRRLVKSVEQWEFSKTSGMRFMFGKPDISAGSSVFEEWRKKALSAIVLIFGEHSHYVDDFNDIEYSDLYTALLDDKKASEEKFWQGVSSAKELLQEMIKEIDQDTHSSTRAATSGESSQASAPAVFIGHGRSPLWLAVKSFLENDCGLHVVSFESESRTSESIVSILEQMLDQVGLAVIVLTAEDATADGHVRARQNVIHEAGLLQGKLGFKKVVILKQDGVEELTNLAGLQYISFKDRIEQAFYDLGKVLKREGL